MIILFGEALFPHVNSSVFYDAFLCFPFNLFYLIDLQM